jgi:outer membrane lipoprotein LolB
LRHLLNFLWPLVRASLTLILALSAGCASLRAPEGVTPAPSAALDSFRLLGRVSVRYGDEGFSGSMDWRHSPASDDLMILSPLGQGVAHLTRDGDGYTLTTSDQQVFHAPDAESLTEQALGWRLPLAGLPYWVQGLPVPGSDADVRRDPAGAIERVGQNGWTIDYSGHRAFSAGVMPSRVFMETTDLRLKLVIEDWQRGP